MSIQKRQFAAAILAAGFLAAGAVTVAAQQLDPGISCIEGNVPGDDWAELNSKYKESIWDSKSAIRLRSFEDALNLKVTDQYGSTVCEATADSRTRCKFSFSSDYSGTFNIQISNPRSTRSAYRLCAE